MKSPAASAPSAVALLATLRAGAWLPLSCRRGATVLSGAGEVVGAVTEIITGEWARVTWTNGLVSEVHGSQLGDASVALTPGDVDVVLDVLLGDELAVAS